LDHRQDWQLPMFLQVPTILPENCPLRFRAMSVKYQYSTITKTQAALTMANMMSPHKSVYIVRGIAML
jgi:hypothetical protein